MIRAPRRKSRPIMKTPVFVAILILAISTTVGWRRNDILRSLREEEKSLVRKSRGAAGGTIPMDGRPTARKRESREDMESAARTEAVRMIESLKGQEAPAPGEEYSKMEARIETILEPLYRMNSPQLRVLIDELLKLPDPAHSTWYGRSLRNAITALANTEPEAAMALLENGDERWEKHLDGRHELVIGKWAATDPQAAIAWMREHRPEGGEIENLFVRGLAIRDPRLAFQAMLEFEVYEFRGDGEYEGKPNFSEARQIAQSARTLENRTAMLGILREISDLPGEDPDNVRGLIVENALSVMAEGIGTYGPERTKAWLKSLNLRPDEARCFMRGVRQAKFTAEQGAGRWQEWLGELDGFTEDQ
jgi:hypothetical protein